jgi:hypothetical protein
MTKENNNREANCYGYAYAYCAIPECPTCYLETCDTVMTTVRDFFGWYDTNLDGKID